MTARREQPPKRFYYMRWKPYGFTHIGLIEEGEYGKALCGNSPYSHWNDLEGYHGDKILAPSLTNDNKRPVCGNCMKHRIRNMKKRAAERKSNA